MKWSKPPRRSGSAWVIDGAARAVKRRAKAGALRPIGSRRWGRCWCESRRTIQRERFWRATAAATTSPKSNSPLMAACVRTCHEAGSAQAWGFCDRPPTLLVENPIAAVPIQPRQRDGGRLSGAENKGFVHVLGWVRMEGPSGWRIGDPFFQGFRGTSMAARRPRRRGSLLGQGSDRALPSSPVPRGRTRWSYHHTGYSRLRKLRAD